MMDLGRTMGSLSFVRRLAVPIVMALAFASTAAAQTTPEMEQALIQLANEAEAAGLPAAPLVNKIREGLAKGVEPARIEVVVRRMAADLETADRLMRELLPEAHAEGRAAAVTLLAEAIGSGVTADEVRDLRRIAPASSATLATTAPDGLASAAKGLSLVKEARLSGDTVIAEAVRQGYRSVELLDLGRQIKRREADYRAGRASLDALRDAIARGERPDQIFGASRPARVERPAAARPEPIERPTRPATPERPQRPERPARPERPGATR